MDRNDRPQKYSDQFTAESQVHEVRGHQQVVGERNKTTPAIRSYTFRDE